jgi:hypothetical protein
VKKLIFYVFSTFTIFTFAFSPIFSFIASASTELFTNTDFEADTSSWNVGDANWWTSGGVSASNVVAAYQAEGASSYATSKINLANSLTHALIDAEGTTPSWSVSNGWTYDGTNYLLTDISSADIGRLTGSFLIKFSDAHSCDPNLGCQLMGAVNGFVPPVDIIAVLPYYNFDDGPHYGAVAYGSSDDSVVII